MRLRHGMVTALAIVFGFLLSLVPAGAKAEDAKEMTHMLNQPAVVSLVVKDVHGKPAAGVGVVVMSHADPTKSEKVFEGKTDADGKIVMRPQEDVSVLSASRKTDVMDVVYTAYIMSETEFKPIHFSVPYIRPEVRLSKNDIDLLAADLSVVHEVTLSQPRDVKMAQQSQATEAQPTALPPGCSIGQLGWAWCPISSTVSPNTLTTVGELHTTEGLQAKLTLTSSSKVKIQAGLKIGDSTSGTWGQNGTVTMSAATTTTYELPGDCSLLGCAYGREVRTYYKYRYEHNDVYQDGILKWSQHTVTPVEFVGYGEFGAYLGGQDGRNPVQVENNQWGDKVSIGKGVSTQKNRSLETTYGWAFEVPTFVGSWSGGVETSWVSSHTIDYKGTSLYNKYWLYDLNTSGRMWYAAAPDTR